MTIFVLHFVFPIALSDACDIGLVFDISPYHCTKIMRYVIKYWINANKSGGINMGKYLSDRERMESVSKGFSSRSNGVFKGAIGAEHFYAFI